MNECIYNIPASKKESWISTFNGVPCGGSVCKRPGSNFTRELTGGFSTTIFESNWSWSSFIPGSILNVWIVSGLLSITAVVVEVGIECPLLLLDTGWASTKATGTMGLPFASRMWTTSGSHDTWDTPETWETPWDLRNNDLNLDRS